jgi:DNA-binding CsgD family transcriptional regulator
MALDLADRAEAMSKRIETKGLVPWTRALLANRPEERDHVAFAFNATLATGNIDSFVTVYRSCPRVLQILIDDDRYRDSLRTTLKKAHDTALAGEIGLQIGPTSPTVDPDGLTPREREVLELVSQGLTNKQIGRALFIEEGTVKAHMRNLCKKLGVRTRTEAAIRASEFGGLT